jgi:hypothetical protein
MKKLLFAVSLIISSLSVFSQTTYDSKTLVDTNNNSNSTVTSTNTNNSNNVNVTTVTSTNTNNNNNVSVSENTNINSGHTTSDNKNTNINANYSTSTSSQIVNSTNNSSNYNKNDIEQKIVQPPPTAIAPNMMSGGNNDLCSTGVGGALQTQILGLSGGKTTRDFNCERLKLSKTMYDMGMKVAAVSVLCQDRRVFDAMMEAGTPCPFEGKIGEAARQAWLDNPSRVPQSDKEAENVYKNTGTGIISRIINWLF